MGAKMFKNIKRLVAIITVSVLMFSTILYGTVRTYATEMTPSDAMPIETINVEEGIEVTETVSTTETAEIVTTDTEEFVDPGSYVREVSNGEPSITYSVHCEKYGWMSPVSDGRMAGTSGESKRLEAIGITINSNGAVDEQGNPLTGGIKYRTHVERIGWQDWVESSIDGDSISVMIDNQKYAGTMGRSLRLEGIEIQLTGNIANYYDVYYRTHVESKGWMSLVCNGAMSGTEGESKRLEGIEIFLVKKNQEASASISYTVHCEKYGWLDEISPEVGEYNSNTVSGTIGESKRLEAIVINLETDGVSGGIEYSTHVESKGWMDPVGSGQLSGTSGESKRMEAITINLTGVIATHYDIYYRVHVQDLGWLDWASNGQKAGSQGASKRMEAIQICLVKKGNPAPGSTEKPFYNFNGSDWRIIPGALSIRVNKQMNCITIYKGNVPIKAMVCSTGTITPIGTFDLKQKWRWKELIHDVYGQYSCHITGNFLFHSVPYDDPNIWTLFTSDYNKLGQTASAGCIRLTTADAKWMYDNCPIGTQIIIYNSSDPGPLGKPSAQKLPAGQTWDPTDPLINR